MKLIVVSDAGEHLCEMKLSQELLRRPDYLCEQLNQSLTKKLTKRQEQHEDIIIEHAEMGLLESIDDDGSIMDVPLNLKEACGFSFDKHVDAIVSSENEANEEHKRSMKFDADNDYAKRYDARYKERPGNRIRYK
jgi:hypothetical protein